MAQSNEQPESDTLARIDKLVDAVKYQEGSVASKTLIDKETGTIILFAFAKGRGCLRTPLLSISCYRSSRVKPS